jgi:F0F1-type ATP synthase assembly protein I
MAMSNERATLAIKKFVLGLVLALMLFAVFKSVFPPFAVGLTSAFVGGLIAYVYYRDV